MFSALGGIARRLGSAAGATAGMARPVGGGLGQAARGLVGQRLQVQTRDATANNRKMKIGEAMRGMRRR